MAIGLQNKDRDFDVIIVGCGLVGAVMALLLRRSNLRIAVADRQAFDKSKAPFNSGDRKFDARVSALTVKSEQILEKLAVFEAVQALRYCPYADMEVWDGEGTGSVHFNAANLGQNHLGSIVENSVLLSALNEQLDKADNLTSLIPFTIDSIERTDRAIVLRSNEGDEYSTGLLIGADGANSRVRELMSFPTREWDYHHTAVVTTVETELPHQQTAWQRFMATGPLAFLPLRQVTDDDQRFCSIVWSLVPEQAERIMSLDDKAFCGELGHAFERRLGEIRWADKRFQLPLRQRHASSYYQDGVALIGDAAHTIHPLAGQGVNLGLLDAEELAAQISAGIVAGREIDDPRLLARYQRKRKAHNLGMMWMMEGFKHLFAEQAPPVQWLRNAGLDVVNNFDLLKNELARRAMGIG